MTNRDDPRVHRLLQSHRRQVGFYTLLMLVLLGGIGGLFVSGARLTEDFSHAVQAGEFWALMTDRLTELRRLVEAVDDPGNEVFITGRIDDAERETTASLQAFRTALEQVRGSLDAAHLDAATETRMLARLDVVSRESALVASAAMEMFVDVRGRRLKDALAHNATMDGHLGAASRTLSDMHTSVSQIQGQLYQAQGVSFASLRRLQLTWAGGFLLLGVLTYVTGLLNVRTATRRTRDAYSQQDDLATSEARFRSLSETVPVGIVEADAQGSCLYGNERMVPIFGIPLHSLLGHGWTACIHPADLPGLLATYREAAARSLPWAYDYRLLHTDGSIRYVEVHFAPLQQGGSYVGTVEDVTERRRLTEALKEARHAAEAASEAKSEFLANMSHEIRTPLNGILGMTELLLGTRLKPRQIRYLQLVKQSGDALLAVINDILDFSKIEAGKLALAQEPVDLRTMVSDILQLLAIAAHRKGLEIVADVGSDVPPSVFADAMRLRQVLINLVGNAVKFTDHGEVVVRIAARAPAEAPVPLDFSVQDTGVGISEEQQRSIFQAFVQGDTALTRAHGGTGLGLTISARLVALMGGRIQVESQPGLGSRFSFTLDLLVAPAVASPLAPPFLKGRSVLVVDDNETNLLVLQRTLSQWGMRVTAAGHGRAALEAAMRAAASGAPFDLMLTDLCMPDMDGLALIEALRGLGLGDAAMLMLSSADGPGDPESRRKLGIVRHLMKPVNQADLLQGVLAALNGSLPEQPSSHEDLRALRPLRILVAEDHDVNQILMHEVLQDRGHAVTLAANGIEAVETAGREAFDVIVMDVQMPDMDGLEATSRIRLREAGEGRHTPILALTAYALQGDEERCLQAGMDAYLSKPVDVRQLCDMVERMAGAGKAATAP